jgi:hypothetical protein
VDTKGAILMAKLDICKICLEPKMVNDEKFCRSCSHETEEEE